MSKKTSQAVTAQRSNTKRSKATQDEPRQHLHQGQTLYSQPIGPPTLAEYKAEKLRAKAEADIYASLDKSVAEWKPDNAAIQQAAEPMMKSLRRVVNIYSATDSVPIDVIEELKTKAAEFAFGSSLGHFEHSCEQSPLSGLHRSVTNTDVRSAGGSYRDLRIVAEAIYHCASYIVLADKSFINSDPDSIVGLNDKYGEMRRLLDELEGDSDERDKKVWSRTFQLREIADIIDLNEDSDRGRVAEKLKRLGSELIKLGGQQFRVRLDGMDPTYQARF